MATERVYHPETCEPFDVPASKAVELCLNQGWSRTPWQREAQPEPAVRETRKGRGRQRIVLPEEPSPVEDDLPPAEVEDDAD
jgi:hypothetical protein